MTRRTSNLLVFIGISLPAFNNIAQKQKRKGFSFFLKVSAKVTKFFCVLSFCPMKMYLPKKMEGVNYLKLF